MLNKGLFVVFEGAEERCGKTTLVNKTIEKLIENEIVEEGDIIYLREPGGTKVGEMIRNIVKYHNMDYKCEALLYAASRQNLQAVIKEALNNNKLVICDRYIATNIAYQGYGRGLGVDYVNRVNDDIIKPDLYINIVGQIQDKPIEERKDRADDKFDNVSNDFVTKAKEGYKEFFRNRLDTLTIEAKDKLEDKVETCIECIEAFLNYNIDVNELYDRYVKDLSPIAIVVDENKRLFDSSYKIVDNLKIILGYILKYDVSVKTSALNDFWFVAEDGDDFETTIAILRNNSDCLEIKDHRILPYTKLLNSVLYKYIKIDDFEFVKDGYRSNVFKNLISIKSLLLSRCNFGLQYEYTNSKLLPYLGWYLNNCFFLKEDDNTYYMIDYTHDRPYYKIITNEDSRIVKILWEKDKQPDRLIKKLLGLRIELV